MNPVTSAPFYSSSSKGDHFSTPKIDLRDIQKGEASYSLLHNKKITPTDYKLLADGNKLSHGDDKQVSDHVLRFYERDQDDHADGDDDSSSFEDSNKARKIGTHLHQQTEESLTTTANVFSGHTAFSRISPSFSGKSSLPTNDQALSAAFSKKTSPVSDDVLTPALPSDVLPEASLPIRGETSKNILSEELLLPKKSLLEPEQVLPSITQSAAFITSLSPVSATAVSMTASYVNKDAAESNESDLFSADDLVGKNNKTLSSQQSDGAIAASSLMSAGITHAQKNNSLNTFVTSQNSISEPVAAALRLNQFLDELSAAADKIRLNTDTGNDVTINLRSDILEGTNVRINANATHIAVSFSTNNAESNTLLNSNLAVLQNHLVSLCPGQVVSIKADLLTSTTPSNSSSEEERSGKNSAGADEKNRESF